MFVYNCYLRTLQLIYLNKQLLFNRIIIYCYFLICLLFSCSKYSIVTIAIFSLIDRMRKLQIGPLPFNSCVLFNPDNSWHKSVLCYQKCKRHIFSYSHLHNRWIFRVVYQFKVITSGEFKFHGKSRDTLWTAVSTYNWSIFAFDVIVNDLNNPYVAI